MSMENYFLPADIIMDILSRLPAESVLQCKLVCKAWRSLVHDPSFVHKHLLRRHCDRHNASKVGLLFYDLNGELLFHFLPLGERKIYYGEYDDNQSNMKLRRINFHPPDHMGQVIGSCNGLICISIRHHKWVEDPVYVCNPITRECVNLPKFNFALFEERYGMPGRMVVGFGYHFSTNQYKVVRIFYPISQPSVGQVQVYTLGSNSGWRNKGDITFSMPLIGGLFPGVLANGALHWVDWGGKILAFDLADESFRLLPSPPCFQSYNGKLNVYTFFALGVFGGWISVYNENNDGTAEVWSLKKNNTTASSSSSNYDMKQQDYHQFWTWTKELSIKMQGTMAEDDNDYRPFAYMTKSGEVLFCDRTMFNCQMCLSGLSRYDQETATIKNFVNLDVNDNLPSFRVMPHHINSFVSLRALGEENAKTI